MKLTIHTDGGARGNPGPAGIGIVFTNEAGEIVQEYSETIGETTNNVAEYTALLKALEYAQDFGAEELDCYLDSELVVKQLNKEYKVKNKDLGKIFIQVWNLQQKYKKVTYSHVARAQNSHADMLVNKALDAIDN